MAVPKRSSPIPQKNATTRDLKQRVITNLNKLSDRDTQAIATSELESIARNLNNDSFSPFLNCIYDTDSSEKTPVRKQCVRLLGFLSQTHGDALSPFLSKMLANIVRRLRDPDSAVRQACVDAVTAMASQITKPPFSVFLKPLTEALLLEQDYNAQIGSALCLASAIEASPDPEPLQFQKLLPRLLKLLKAECFKAKPALLSLIGSIAAVGGASSRNVLTYLVPSLVEYLSSDDWAARKAASEAFLKLAIVERNQLSEFKISCLASFEARRFDKVKAVRETMNQMMEAWKDVPGLSEEVTQPSQSISSSRENASDGRFPPGSRSPNVVGFETPQMRKKSIPTSRSPPPDSSSETAATKRTPLKSNDRKSSSALFRNLDRKKSPDWKVEVGLPHASSLTVVCKDDIKKTDGGCPESGVDESNTRSRLQAKRVLFNKNYNDKTHKFGGFRSGNRVVPFHDEGSDSTVVVSNATEMYGNQKDNEDLSLIRKQLVQIENQQSSLLDLLQKFIGSSQNGMRSLETRVHGLELALDEISYDLAMSTAKISGTDSAGNTCCKLPGAEFLSSKFWRRTEGRYPSSRLSSAGGSLAAIQKIADKDGSSEPLKMDNWRFRLQRGGGGVIVNPLAEIHSKVAVEVALMLLLLSPVDITTRSSAWFNTFILFFHSTEWPTALHSQFLHSSLRYFYNPPTTLPWPNSTRKIEIMEGPRCLVHNIKKALHVAGIGRAAKPDIVFAESNTILLHSRLDKFSDLLHLLDFPDETDDEKFGKDLARPSLQDLARKGHNIVLVLPHKGEREACLSFLAENGEGREAEASLLILLFTNSGRKGVLSHHAGATEEEQQWKVEEGEKKYKLSCYLGTDLRRFLFCREFETSRKEEKENSKVRDACTHERASSSERRLRSDTNTLTRLNRFDIFEAVLNIVDVPKERNNDKANKVILKEMYQLAALYPPPSTIILITGDEGVIQSLQDLAHLGHKIVLVIPHRVRVPSALLNGATADCLPWAAATLARRRIQRYGDLSPVVLV
ncbi:hypothetical protein NE237_020547 [Protea cynaroides]|uniref:TORTIFOLIA1/SINE1-2 N-terminal domain-containing protein n=1 Tax=Protea cynaroides TaxID=273540 RepID=A0A9Q0H6A4_9MAGN|nr:hypothetical protein NE237_020547 [Protea cynaroides]